MARCWPLGELVRFVTTSLGTVDFTTGHSKRTQDPDSPTHASGAIAGSEDSYDLYGDAPAPIPDPLWVYEYWLEAIEGTDVGVVRADLQDKYNQLKAIITGVDGSGVSGRVGTLTALDWQHGPVTGRARLVDVKTLDLYYSMTRLQITFQIDAGYHT